MKQSLQIVNLKWVALGCALGSGLQSCVDAKVRASFAAPTCFLILVSGKRQAEISAGGLDNQTGETSGGHLRLQVM